MIVGVCKLELILPECHSLKDKRRILRSLKDRTAHKFSVTVAEVDAQDLWQRAVLGFAVVGGEGAWVGSLVDRIKNYIGSLGLAQVARQDSELIHFEGSS